MTQSPPQSDQAQRAPGRAAAIAAAMIAFAALRIATTYRVFSATADEATHVGAGLELLQYGKYELQRENPPIPRVILAVAPHLAGMRFQRGGTYGDELHSVFYGSGRYERNLFAARIGNLLFLLTASVALFVWTRNELGDAAALVALFLFTFQPAILGHAGLATADIAATAGFAVSVATVAAWLRHPTIARAAAFAAAYAFATTCKFSNIAFVPLACAAIVVVRAFRTRALVRRMWTLIAAVVVVTPLVIWALYAFNVGTFESIEPVRDAFGPRIDRFIAAHPTMRVPAPAFIFGVMSVIRIDRDGHPSYFLGHVSRDGWPLYFTTTIALKTTIAFLLLVFVALILARRSALRGPMGEAAAAAIAILLVASRSKLDLGIRYVLPVLVPLTFLAAASAIELARQWRHGVVMAATILLLHAVPSMAAHPDYFPYFNAFAGPDPSRILVDSNLDWGQDVLRLRRALRKRQVDTVGLACTGPADYGALGFPRGSYRTGGMTPIEGWFAVSDHVYRMDRASFGAWMWLAPYKYKRVGKSIRLYHLP